VTGAPGAPPRIRHGGIYVTRFVEEDSPEHAYQLALNNLDLEIDRVIDNPTLQPLRVIVQDVIEDPSDFDPDRQPELVFYYED
jgi:hypothetical protein